MACLVVTEGPAEGQRMALEGHRLVMIGRDPDCSFQILDETISRRHVQVRLDEAGSRHYAVDCGSTNGVMVNEQQIREDTALSDGDTIRIGDTCMVYAVDDDAAAQSVMDILRRQGERRRSTIGIPKED